MKKSKVLRSLAILVAIAGSTVALHAQIAGSGDTVVQVTAEANGLTLLPSGGALERFGTYWLIEPGFGGAAPSPVPPADPCPIFELGAGQYLCDLTVNQQLDPAKASVILQAQAEVVVNLINFINSLQAAQADNQTTTAMGRGLPGWPPSGPGGGGGLGFI